MASPACDDSERHPPSRLSISAMNFKKAAWMSVSFQISVDEITCVTRRASALIGGAKLRSAGTLDGKPTADAPPPPPPPGAHGRPELASVEIDDHNLETQLESICREVLEECRLRPDDEGRGRVV